MTVTRGDNSRNYKYNKHLQVYQLLLEKTMQRVASPVKSSTGVGGYYAKAGNELVG